MKPSALRQAQCDSQVCGSDCASCLIGFELSGRMPGGEANGVAWTWWNGTDEERLNEAG